MKLSNSFFFPYSMQYQSTEHNHSSWSQYMLTNMFFFLFDQYCNKYQRSFISHERHYRFNIYFHTKIYLIFYALFFAYFVTTPCFDQSTIYSALRNSSWQGMGDQKLCWGPIKGLLEARQVSYLLCAVLSLYPTLMHHYKYL